MIKKNTKKKEKRNIVNATVNVHSTFNNTIVSIGDEKGNILAWSSAGAVGFKGTKKSTSFAAQMVAEKVAKAAIEHGVKTVKIHCKGTGLGKDAAIRGLQSVGLEITKIKDVTAIAHNGCRLPKRPRG